MARGVRIEERQVDRFTAADDEGREHEVFVFQSFIVTTALSQKGPGEHPGAKRFNLRLGAPVNRVDDDTFRIAANGKVIRRIR